MSFAQTMLPFLRPLAPPRAATVRHFLRFSQSCRAQAAATIDRNLLASQTASPSYPPPSLKSLPRPKESHASHRTRHPTKERNYPDRAPRQSSLAIQPTAAQPLPTDQVAPNLPYFVTRTGSNELPIYHLRKRGGNLMQTRVKKISGDVNRLREALEASLGVAGKDCVVNRTTQHVVVKGWHKPRIEAFLKARMF